MSQGDGRSLGRNQPHLYTGTGSGGGGGGGARKGLWCWIQMSILLLCCYSPVNSVISVPEEDLGIQWMESVEVLWSVHSQIYKTNCSINPLRCSGETLLVPARSDVIDFDVHYSRRLLFYSDVEGYLYRFDRDISSEAERRTISPHNPVYLSVDWLNDQLYVATGSEIQICSLDLYGCNKIYSTPYPIRQIIADPYNGFLFISDLDLVIHRYDLDPSGSSLASSGINVTHSGLGRSTMRFYVEYSALDLFYGLNDDHDNESTSITFTNLDGELSDVYTTIPSGSLTGVHCFKNNDHCFWWTGSGIFGLHSDDVTNTTTILASTVSLHDLGESSILKVAHRHSQPVPKPLLPSREMRALFSQRSVNLSWLPPQPNSKLFVFGQKKFIQSEFAWHQWMYEVNVTSQSGVRLYDNLTETQVLLGELNPNTSYTFSLVAYSSSGRSLSLKRSGRTSAGFSENAWVYLASENQVIRSTIHGVEGKVINITTTTDVKLKDVKVLGKSVFLLFTNDSLVSVSTDTEQSSVIHRDATAFALDWVGGVVYVCDGENIIRMRSDGHPISQRSILSHMVQKRSEVVKRSADVQNVFERESEVGEIVVKNSGKAHALQMDSVRGRLFYANRNSLRYHTLGLNLTNSETVDVTGAFTLGCGGCAIGSVSIDYGTDSIYWMTLDPHQTTYNLYSALLDSPSQKTLVVQLPNPFSRLVVFGGHYFGLIPLTGQVYVGDFTEGSLYGTLPFARADSLTILHESMTPNLPGFFNVSDQISSLTALNDWHPANLSITGLHDNFTIEWSSGELSPFVPLSFQFSVREEGKERDFCNSLVCDLTGGGHSNVNPNCSCLLIALEHSLTVVGFPADSKFNLFLHPYNYWVTGLVSNYSLQSPEKRPISLADVRLYLSEGPSLMFRWLPSLSRDTVNICIRDDRDTQFNSTDTQFNSTMAQLYDTESQPVNSVSRYSCLTESAEVGFKDRVPISEGNNYTILMSVCNSAGCSENTTFNVTLSSDILSPLPEVGTLQGTSLQISPYDQPTRGKEIYNGEAISTAVVFLRPSTVLYFIINGSLYQAGSSPGAKVWLADLSSDLDLSSILLTADSISRLLFIACHREQSVEHSDGVHTAVILTYDITHQVMTSSDVNYPIIHLLADPQTSSVAMLSGNEVFTLPQHNLTSARRNLHSNNNTDSANQKRVRRQVQAPLLSEVIDPVRVRCPPFNRSLAVTMATDDDTNEIVIYALTGSGQILASGDGETCSVLYLDATIVSASVSSGPTEYLLTLSHGRLFWYNNSTNRLSSIDMTTIDRDYRDYRSVFVGNLTLLLSLDQAPFPSDARCFNVSEAALENITVTMVTEVGSIISFGLVDQSELCPPYSWPPVLYRLTVCSQTDPCVQEIITESPWELNNLSSYTLYTYSLSVLNAFSESVIPSTGFFTTLTADPAPPPPVIVNRVTSMAVSFIWRPSPSPNQPLENLTYKLLLTWTVFADSTTTPDLTTTPDPTTTPLTTGSTTFYASAVNSDSGSSTTMKSSSSTTMMSYDGVNGKLIALTSNPFLVTDLPPSTHVLARVKVCTGSRGTTNCFGSPVTTFTTFDLLKEPFIERSSSNGAVLTWRSPSDGSVIQHRFIMTKNDLVIWSSDVNAATKQSTLYRKRVDGLTPWTEYSVFINVLYAESYKNVTWPEDNSVTVITLGVPPEEVTVSYRGCDGAECLFFYEIVMDTPLVPSPLPSADDLTTFTLTITCGNLSIDVPSSSSPVQVSMSLLPGSGQCTVSGRAVNSYGTAYSPPLSVRLQPTGGGSTSPGRQTDSPVPSDGAADQKGLAIGLPIAALFLCALVAAIVYKCVRNHRDSRIKLQDTIALSTISSTPPLTPPIPPGNVNGNHISTNGTPSSIMNLSPGNQLGALRESRLWTVTNSALYHHPSESESRPSTSSCPPLRELDRSALTLHKLIGAGAFGEVYEGTARGLHEENTIYANQEQTTPTINQTERSVAVKTLRPGASYDDKEDFMKEAMLMSQFDSDHIVTLLGVCLNTEPFYLILELMDLGDLVTFLRASRPTPEVGGLLGLLDLMQICGDVAKGCLYLENHHFVHRDLAARNCLVKKDHNEGLRVKLGDFGLARDIYHNDYYRKRGEALLPVRWMSPESLLDGVFTTQSDIWAFGVLCWEVFTLGMQPYQARSNIEVLQFVRNAGVLERPLRCPNQMYHLISECWSFAPVDRPAFKSLMPRILSLRETFMASPCTEIETYERSNARLQSTSEFFSSLSSEVTTPIPDLVPVSVAAVTAGDEEDDDPKRDEVFHEDEEPSSGATGRQRQSSGATGRQRQSSAPVSRESSARGLRRSWIFRRTSSKTNRHSFIEERVNSMGNTSQRASNRYVRSDSMNSATGQRRLLFHEQGRTISIEDGGDILMFDTPDSEDRHRPSRGSFLVNQVLEEIVGSPSQSPVHCSKVSPPVGSLPNKTTEVTASSSQQENQNESFSGNQAMVPSRQDDDAATSSHNTSVRTFVEKGSTIAGSSNGSTSFSYSGSLPECEGRKAAVCVSPSPVLHSGVTSPVRPAKQRMAVSPVTVNYTSISPASFSVKDTGIAVEGADTAVGEDGPTVHPPSEDRHTVHPHSETPLNYATVFLSDGPGISHNASLAKNTHEDSPLCGDRSWGHNPQEVRSLVDPGLEDTSTMLHKCSVSSGLLLPSHSSPNEAISLDNHPNEAISLDNHPNEAISLDDDKILLHSHIGVSSSADQSVSLGRKRLRYADSKHASSKEKDVNINREKTHRKPQIPALVHGNGVNSSMSPGMSSAVNYALIGPGRGCGTTDLTKNEQTNTSHTPSCDRPVNYALIGSLSTDRSENSSLIGQPNTMGHVNYAVIGESKTEVAAIGSPVATVTSATGINNPLKPQKDPGGAVNHPLPSMGYVNYALIGSPPPTEYMNFSAIGSSSVNEGDCPNVNVDPPLFNAPPPPSYPAPTSPFPPVDRPYHGHSHSQQLPPGHSQSPDFNSQSPDFNSQSPDCNSQSPVCDSPPSPLVDYVTLTSSPGDELRVPDSEMNSVDSRRGEDGHAANSESTSSSDTSSLIGRPHRKAPALAALPKINQYKYGSVTVPSMEKEDSITASMDAESGTARQGQGQSFESSGNHDDRNGGLNYMTATSFQSSDDGEGGEEVEDGRAVESLWGGRHFVTPPPNVDAPSPQVPSSRRGTLGSRSSTPRSIEDPRTGGVLHRMGSRGISIESLLSESSLAAIDYTGAQPVRLQGTTASTGFSSDNETCV